MTFLNAEGVATNVLWAELSNGLSSEWKLTKKLSSYQNVPNSHTMG